MLCSEISLLGVHPLYLLLTSLIVISGEQKNTDDSTSAYVHLDFWHACPAFGLILCMQEILLV